MKYTRLNTSLLLNKIKISIDNRRWITFALSLAIILLLRFLYSENSYIEIKRRETPLTEKTKFLIKDKIVERSWKLSGITFTAKPDCSKNHEITYYIKSHYASGYLRRNRVRETWGKSQNIVFLTFSKDLLAQYTPPDHKSRDMLTTNSYPESVELLSVKIALGVYHASQCHQHAFFTDDDVHIFPSSIEQKIGSVWDLETTVSARGNVHFNEPVVRDKHSPWAKYIQTIEEYPYARYPPYANGAGYIASFKAIEEIAKTLPYSKLLRHVDDVYFGLLLRNAGITIENDSNFTTALEHLRTKDTYPCGLYNIHGVYKIETFIEIKDKQCKTSDKFKIKNWKTLQDPYVDHFDDSIFEKIGSALRFN